MSILDRLRRALGIVSPSEVVGAEAERLVRVVLDGFAEGVRQAEVRRAAGLHPEPLSPAALACMEGVMRRSFWLLDDDDADE